MSDYFPIPEARRFDRLRDPIPVKFYLRPLVWLLSFPIFWMPPAQYLSRLRDIAKMM